MLVNLAKTLIYIVACICYLNIAKAQNFTTKGTEFWTAYGAHASMYKTNGDLYTNGGTQKMVFYFLSSRATTVTVEIPSIGWSKKYKVIAGRTIETDEMPKAGVKDIRLLDEGVFSKGIHITSDDLITAYCHVYDDKSSATTLLIPVNIAGQEYYTLGYTQLSSNPYARAYCFVIATEDNTEIEVIPAANTLHHHAGVPFFQKLNKGEVLNLFGDSIRYTGKAYKAEDLSGTYIRTVIQQDNDICKKVVVFSGSAATSIVCKDSINYTNYTADNLFEQVPCLDDWGKSFIAIPTSKMEMNRYRVMVLDPKQKVFVNGRLLNNLIRGRYYEFKTDKELLVRSDSLITMAQYISSANQCGNELAGQFGGDPEMMFLSPVGSGITSTIINATTHNNILAHYINVITKTIFIDSFRLDGQAVPSAFNVLSHNPNYAYAQIQVTPGRHVLECDSGFNAYAYGYGKLESYGYNAGYSTKHLAGNLGVSNPYINLQPNTVVTCTATSFRFYFDVEVKLLSLFCKFNYNNHLQPNQDVWLTNLQPDSSYHVDSINTTFYRYHLPEIYHYNMVEGLPIQLVAYYPDVKGCIVKKQFNFLVNVIQKPIASLYAKYDNCVNNPLLLNDNSLSFGNSNLVQWQWDFSDGKTSSERNPQHQYEDYGEYNLRMRVINDVGCYGDTAQKVGMYHRPVSSFDVSGIACNKQDILLKSTATVKNDVLAAWEWNFPDHTTALAQELIKQFDDSGNYEIKFIAKTQHSCTDTAIKMLHIYKTPEIIIPAVLYSAAGDTMRIQPVYKGNIRSYAWSPSTFLNSTVAPYPITAATNDITYNITAFAADAPCKASAAIAIKMQKKIYIPTAFTPNGDGLNDTWHIQNIEDYANCTIEVYSRWGNRVFFSKGYSAPWNGMFNNQPLPAGTYLFIVNTHSSNNNTRHTGTVTIIR